MTLLSALMTLTFPLKGREVRKILLLGQILVISEKRRDDCFKSAQGFHCRGELDEVPGYPAVTLHEALVIVEYFHVFSTRRRIF